jgi:mercuric ion binding protein
MIVLALLWSAHALASDPYVLVVDGLACPFCAYGIEKKFTELPGVAAVDIDIDGGKVLVTMSSGATLSEKDARKAVRDAGFTLRTFSPSGHQ